MEAQGTRTLAFFLYFASAYRWRALLMVVLLAVAGLLEGVGVISLVPLLEAAAAPDGAPSSGIVLAVQNGLGAVGIEPTLGALVMLVIVSITLKAGVLFLAMSQVGFMVARVTLDLRLQLIRALLEARWSYFGEHPIGSFANSISSEAVRSAAAFMEACVIVAGLFQVGVYMVAAAIISWQVSVAAVVTGAVVLVGLRSFIGMGRSAGQQVTTLTRSLAGRLVDALQGMKPMKAMAREEFYWPLLRDEAEGLNRAQRLNVISAQALRLFQEPVVTVVLGFGLLALLTFTDRSFSAIVVLAFIFYRLMTSWNTLQVRYQVMVVGESAFWSLRGQIERAQAAVESHPGRRQPDGLREMIELRDVSFAYDDLVVLDHLSMVVQAGRITALIGRSGSGKTTILDLLTGLRRPNGGEVYVDGLPLGDLDVRSWRGLIGYVPQDVFLFHDTVRRNLTLGDETITDDDVVKALRDSGAWDFIMRDPEGLDAVVAPQGSAFSGGQRQRLAIARALAKRPALLVLDEATTGLDEETEAGILRTLVGLRGKVTILAISHQPALKEAADVVFELDGAAVRDGSGEQMAGKADR